MENSWQVDAGAAVPETAPGGSTAIEVAVIYTSVKQTLAALRTAGNLARGLHARIHLIVPEVVPYPAPADQALVQRQFAERKFRTIAEQSAIDTMVSICLCRDWEDGVLQCVKARSLVVLAASRHWLLPAKERRIARTLRRNGHQVILLEAE